MVSESAQMAELDNVSPNTNPIEMPRWKHRGIFVMGQIIGPIIGHISPMIGCAATK